MKIRKEVIVLETEVVLTNNANGDFTSALLTINDEVNYLNDKELDTQDLAGYFLNKGVMPGEYVLEVKLIKLED